MAEKKEEDARIPQKLIQGAGLAIGGGIMGKAIRDQYVGGKVIKDLRSTDVKFDPFRNKGVLLDPKYDPATGRKQSIFNPERAQRTSDALRTDAARLKPMRKQAVINLAGRKADLRESGGAVRDFAKIRPRLPEGVRTAATNLGLTSGSRASRGGAPASEPAKPKSNVKPEDLKAAREDLPKTRKIGNQFQLRSAAAQLKDQAQPGLAQRIINKANKPLFKGAGDSVKPRSVKGALVRQALVSGGLIAYPKLAELAGEFNASRILGKPNTSTKPGTGKPVQTKNTTETGASDAEVQAKFDDLYESGLKYANREGKDAKWLRQHIINQSVPLGKQFEEYARRNVGRIN